MLILKIPLSHATMTSKEGTYMSGISGVSSVNYSSYGNFASGKKINSAADGAAELSIIENENRQVGGLDAGANNMKSAKEALNISDGALGQVTDYLQRMRELAVQAKNGIYSDSDKQMIQDEINQLKQGISDIAGQTDYNTKKLLDGTNTQFDLAIDADGNSKSFTTANATLQALGIEDFDVTKDFSLQTIDDALDKVTEARGSMGAQSNAFDYALNYNANASYNLTGAKSKLEDLDFPKAISEKKKQQTLQEYALMMQKKRQEQEASKPSIMSTTNHKTPHCCRA